MPTVHHRSSATVVGTARRTASSCVRSSKRVGLCQGRCQLRHSRRCVVAGAVSLAASPSGPDPSNVEAQRDREILGEWHKQAGTGLGPSQVRNQLRRRGIKVSVATVRRVMEYAGYRPPKIKRSRVAVRDRRGPMRARVRVRARPYGFSRTSNTPSKPAT